MGDKLVATDKGFDDFAQRFAAFIQDTSNNPFIMNLQQYSGTGTTGGRNGDGTYSALLAGSKDGLPLAGSLSDKYHALCSALYGAIHGFGENLSQIRVDLHNAKDTLNNGETDALTAAQVLQLLQNVLGGGSSTPPPLPPPKAP